LAGAIQNFGLWETRADVSIDRWFGNDYAVFRNDGLLRKSGGTGTSTLDLAFLNKAVMEPLSGLLAFPRG